uniref:Replication-associated protein n=1 Tax=Phylloscopus tenellipes CRESS-DNA-virus sp. TaxID=2815055 RepID=A0A8A4XCJ0_9VIRU|nr:MAG: replication-associated protein [Phylloscopus tenellipes CRESS-DNA-virus sp.]
MANCKHWCFTSFAGFISFWDHEDVQYCIFGNEKCPKTGRWHKQGYVCFSNKKRLTALKKLDSTAHWEPKRGSVQEAVDYCKKDGDWYEKGDMPIEKGSNKDSFKYCLDMVKEGNFDAIEDSEHLGTYIRYKKTFDSYYKPKLPPYPEPIGIWLHGKPGKGKDTAVIEKYAPYIKPHNKWWDGYDGQTSVLLSDVDLATAKWCGTHLKIWSDRYPFNAEIKGGSTVLHPEKLFVTSNYTIDQLFRHEDATLCNALKRRFEVINCDTRTITKRPRCDYDDLKDLI